MSDKFDWIELLSVLATTGAVVVAMFAIRSENKHRNAERTRADQIRKNDMDVALQRQETEAQRVAEARKSQARRLAKIFDRELSEAARELIALRYLLEHLTKENESIFLQVYAKPLKPKIFEMHERFLDQLDVFPDMLAIGIVNNMTNWSSITVFSEGLENSPGINLLRMRHKMLAEIDEILQLIGETKRELEIYFADLPGLTVFSLEEVRAMNAAKAEKYLQPKT